MIYCVFTASYWPNRCLEEKEVNNNYDVAIMTATKKPSIKYYYCSIKNVLRIIIAKSTTINARLWSAVYE